MLSSLQRQWSFHSSSTGRTCIRATRPGTPRLRSCAALQSAEKELHARAELNDAIKDLRPYVLWDRVVKLTASWDTRGKANMQHICDILEPHVRDKVVITKAEDAHGQPLTCLTIVCKPEHSDEVAAALLQWTPATHITATPSEQCYLPVPDVQVHTTDYGPIDVQLSLAGSTVRKVTPDWAQCQAIADEKRVEVTAVAAAAVEALREGLQDGSVRIDAHRLF